MPATSTAEGWGLTGEAISAQCCALCVAMCLLLPFLRHGGRAGEGWTCAVGAVGTGRTPAMAAGSTCRCLEVFLCRLPAPANRLRAGWVVCCIGCVPESSRV